MTSPEWAVSVSRKTKMENYKFERVFESTAFDIYSRTD